MAIVNRNDYSLSEKHALRFVLVVQIIILLSIPSPIMPGRGQRVRHEYDQSQQS
jgi:hypothetical protein